MYVVGLSDPTKHYNNDSHISIMAVNLLTIVHGNSEFAPGVVHDTGRKFYMVTLRDDERVKGMTFRLNFQMIGRYPNFCFPVYGFRVSYTLNPGTQVAHKIILYAF